MVSTNRVHIQGETCGSIQPTTMVKNMAGAESVRRRLSIIFQRLIAGIEIWPRSLWELLPKPKIQGSSCQSPRAQRCCRSARSFVVRGKFVEELDVGGQRGAREGAFEQIVAEQGVFGHFAVDGFLKSVEIVNALPGERSFAE